MVCQDFVRDQVGICSYLADFYGGFGHEGGTFGYVADTVVEFFYLGNLWGTDSVEYLGSGLDYVWRVSTCVGDGVVDSGFVYHVFAHVVYAYVHQLYCIQCGTAEFRAHGGVSGGSVECEEYPEVCLGASVACSPALFRVPAKGKIAVVEITVADKKCFAAGVFFCGTAVVADCAF